jgi:ATPase subunit of ABC transporter with duplicated ATPase domains
LLLEEPDFLILDEPTNHLDLAARDSVYGMIASWKKGLIVVSHDAAFVEEIGVGRVIDLDCYCLAPSIALDYLL